MPKDTQQRLEANQHLSKLSASLLNTEINSLTLNTSEKGLALWGANVT